MSLFYHRNISIENAFCLNSSIFAGFCIVHTKFGIRGLKIRVRNGKMLTGSKRTEIRAVIREEDIVMIHTRLSWDKIKQHFAYSWWSYALMAALLMF